MRETHRTNYEMLHPRFGASRQYSSSWSKFSRIWSNSTWRFSRSARCSITRANSSCTALSSSCVVCQSLTKSCSFHKEIRFWQVPNASMYRFEISSRVSPLTVAALASLFGSRFKWLKSPKRLRPGAPAQPAAKKQKWRGDVWSTDMEWHTLPPRALTRTLFWILQSFIHFGTRYLPCFCANCIQLSRTISEWNSWSADSRIPCLGFMQKHAHTHVLHARQMQAPRHQSQVPHHRSQVLRHRSQVLRHQSQVLRHQSQVRHPQSQVRHPKRGIAQQLLQCIKKPYEQLTDLLFFLHAVLAELVVWSRSDAKSSCFTGFPSRWHKHVCQSSSQTLVLVAVHHFYMLLDMSWKNTVLILVADHFVFHTKVHFQQLKTVSKRGTSFPELAAC